MSAIAAIGHNNPSPADLTRDLDAELRGWLKEHPVIFNDEEARAAANLAQRAKNTIADLEADRKKLVGPLNDKVKAINVLYGDVRQPIETGLSLIRDRMTDWANAEELRRQEEAERLRLEAIAKQQAASDAIRDAAEAETNAAFGETTDVVAAKQNAVALFNDAKKAQRAFQRAEREAEHIRLAPGLGARSMSPRKQTEYTVTDPAVAIAAIGLTEGIAHEIIKAAKAYRELRGQLPPGISTHETRKV